VVSPRLQERSKLIDVVGCVVMVVSWCGAVVRCAAVLLWCGGRDRDCGRGRGRVVSSVQGLLLSCFVNIVIPKIERTPFHYIPSCHFSVTSLSLLQTCFLSANCNLIFNFPLLLELIVGIYIYIYICIGFQTLVSVAEINYYPTILGSRGA
jgi:hypothetical protein